MIWISLFSFIPSLKVFTHTNIWMIEHNSMKLHYQKKRFLKSLKDGRYYWCRLHAFKRDCKDFQIKKLGGYHDLYVQSFILLLVDVFESFRNRCIKAYEFDRARFLIAFGLAWQVAFKKNKAKVRSFGWHRYVTNGTKTY